MSSNLNEHDLKVAHDLGTLEGQIAAIYENTRVLPELVRKVERHDTQLGLIGWIGGSTVFVFLTAIGTWFKTHFFPGR